MALATCLVFAAAAQATPTFLTGINISDAGQDGFEPDVAVDPSGNVTAVWTRSDGSNFRIQSSSRTPAGAWASAQTISDPGQSASGPHVAVDPSGNAIAVWTRFDGTNGRIQAAYKPAGQQFQAAVTVSASGGDATLPNVSMDNSGNAVVVWERFDGTKERVQVAIRAVGSGAFGTIQTLSAPGEDGDRPVVAAGPSADANAVVAWTRSDGTNLRVQSSRRRDVAGYPRAKGATPTRISLVPAYQPCTSSNSVHGASLSFPSCNPPVPSSSVLTVGTPDANGATANFIGSIKYKVVNGNPATETNEANVTFTVAMTDVRNKPSNSDYTGQVIVSTPLQITDQQNADEQPAPGTTTTLPYQFPVQCTATADTSTGSTCNLTTSANALTPGAVVETKRSLWELGQATVKDAGPDGIVGGANCPGQACGNGDETTFLRAGIFIP